MPQLDTRRLAMYVLAAFVSAFAGALALVPSVTWSAVLKALLAGGAAAAGTAKAFLDVPLVDEQGRAVTKMDVIAAAIPPAEKESTP